MAEVPVIADPNVNGVVSAQIEHAPLDKALRTVLAGTPYLFRRTHDHYIVADGDPQILLVTTLTRMQTDRTLDPDTAACVFELIAPGGVGLGQISLDELQASTADRILHNLADQLSAKQFRAVVRLLESKGSWTTSPNRSSSQ